MAIVTLSHEIGAGGPEIGQQLAERLGCRYVDHADLQRRRDGGGDAHVPKTIVTRRELKPGCPALATRLYESKPVRTALVDSKSEPLWARLTTW
jgi:hypothetical protein